MGVVIISLEAHYMVVPSPESAAPTCMLFSECSILMSMCMLMG